jgi:hypothetical protein
VCGEAGLGDRVVSDEVALQHEREIVGVGVADRCQRFA